ncbi:MAG TPA: outer membrane protein assembly factor BamA [Candidatus Angelobacter sp.]|nr:outer membrane protein assembly factor BamA [Candidatus Angelobacter sp.]
MLFLVSMFLLHSPGVARAQAGQIVEDIQLHGNRRIPKETIENKMFTRRGDIYDEIALQRDLHALWNSGYFEDVRIEREQTAKGWIVHIYVRERPTIRTIDYHGLNSVSTSDVLERFKKAKVPLTVESAYDPTKIIRAKVVLQQLLAEHGRQFAAVNVELQQVPPSSVAVTFNVKEGPKIKVGNITFAGNKHVSTRDLRRAMKNLKPVGVPNSIFLENLFARTFDASKLEEDAQRVQDAYQQRGYYKAIVQDPQTQLHDTPGGILPAIPVPPFRKGQGKSMDIAMSVEEGEKYKLKAINFRNNRAISNTQFLRGLFQMKEGDTFDTHQVHKGLDNLRKAYEELGYIKYTGVPETIIDDEKKELTLNIDIDEGKPFFVRRIEFQGNTTTRDKVIRRELLLQEGQVYNYRLWELSVLRLNQLNYFNTLKAEDDTERKLDEQNGTVDLTVKVSEKGKNSIGLTGGVSGLAGSFIGLNYQTNNFLGLGETLTLQGNVGNRQQDLVFGFTEPYLFDRPIQLGFQAYLRRFDFNQAEQAQIVANQKINFSQDILNNLLNYNQASKGFSVTGSYPLGRRSFKRFSLSYNYDNSTVNVFSDASRLLFETVRFRNISGPDALRGIVTSSVTPSFTASTVDRQIGPTSGRSWYVSSEFAGLGGNVKYYRPLVLYTKFKPVRHKILAMRLQATYIRGFGGFAPAPYQRFYQGGEADLRGFDIRTASPYVFVTSAQNVTLTNPDGTVVPVDPANPRRGCVNNQTPPCGIQIPVPVSTITQPGGDISLISNFEYRIHVVGPVTLAPFVDTGLNLAVQQSQLQLSTEALNQINGTQFGCPTLVSFQCAGGSSLNVNGALKTIPGTNYVPRMSTGLELQVLLPIVQQPFRIYYAYNPLILNTTIHNGSLITRNMFPAGAAGDFTFLNAITTLGPDFRVQEPRKTFRFTISTTF